MSAITDRFYALEAATHPKQRPTMGWRMSRDVAEAIGTEHGMTSSVPRFIMGYPVIVDDTLPPDSLLVEQKPKMGVDPAELTFGYEDEFLTELRAWAECHARLKAGTGNIDDVLGFIDWYQARK